MAQQYCLNAASVGDQGRRLGFNPWVKKIPWRSRGQPTPVFFPGESHGQRSRGAAVHGLSRVRHDLVAKPSPPPPSFYPVHHTDKIISLTK